MNANQQKNLERLLTRWEAALEAYGTPKDFANQTIVEAVNNPDNNLEAPLIIMYAGGYARRGELMAKQKEETTLRVKQDPSPRWPNDGNTACFLCDNVGQAQVRKDNLLLPENHFKDAILVPNKYPAYRPHLLLIKKEHDPQEEKIFNVVTPQYLEEMVKLSFDYGLCSLRNHALAGMSIPGHEHVHLFPESLQVGDCEVLPSCGILNSSLSKTKYGANFFRAENSRFDTLVLGGKETREKTIETTLKILQKLEKEAKVFTLFHHSALFYISPHRQDSPMDSRGQYGGSGLGAYIAIALPQEKKPSFFCDYMSNNSKYIYLKDTFPWEKYI